ncbi:type VII secretion target [Actinoplanes sp. CA-030573]|uniref:type VII secretion target n=1 Tax=Actinoplanes sp. CA-030573 TaxID=3239898 RepID=UPI003D8E4243
MADGFGVDAQQIRDQATRIDAIRQRFGAVTAASAAITQDDGAYGLLCGWMPAVLERRHARQDQLFAYLEENLRLAAEALVQTGREYADVDGTAAERIRAAGRM